VNSATFINHCIVNTALSLSLSIVGNPATVTLLQIEAEEEARLLQEEQESMSLSNKLKHNKKTD
jgi:hypothetical protein